STHGQTVRRGEALLEVYSPDLVLAQREYLVARAAAADMAQSDVMTRGNAKAIAAAALSRLKNWDISADQLARLQRTGTATRTLILAPATCSTASSTSRPCGCWPMCSSKTSRKSGRARAQKSPCKPIPDASSTGAWLSSTRP